MPASRRYIQSVLGSPEASNTVARVLEPAATMATATAAEPVAGIAALLTGDADTVGRVQDRLTYNPRSKAGQEGLKALSDAFVEMAEAIGIDEAVAYFEDTVVPSLQSKFGDEVGAAMGAGLMAGAAVIPVPARKIKAYHGSPHDMPPSQRYLDKETGKTYVAELDNPLHQRIVSDARRYEPIGEASELGLFDINRIGTGEGAQAYGHGLYFAEDEKVAKSYRDSLSARNPNPTYKGRGYDQLDGPEYRALADIEREIKFNKGLTVEQAKDAAIISLNLKKLNARENIDPKRREKVLREYDEDLAALKSIDPSDVVIGGRMYEVDIDVSPDELLDFDAPINQQPKIMKAFRSETLESEMDSPGEMRGMDLLRMLGAEDVTAKGQYASPKAASRLQEAGIKGIKYADAFTRHKSPSQQSKNYVIFDDRLISIAKKYGVAVPAAAVMLSEITGDDPESLYEEA